MRSYRIIILLALLFIALTYGCQSDGQQTGNRESTQLHADSLAAQVKRETLRSWKAYTTYAWGHDALDPLSKSWSDWYSEPLYISPIDAYSTLYIMGFEEETSRIEQYVTDSLDFDKDIDAKIFEVNIRILGGLLSMYDLSQNPAILDKARDFADRMLPAFNTPTGIPTYWVNLKTGVASGDTVNVAEAGTYTFEMGLLSYYTGDPRYYQAGKRATMAIWERRSELGLIGDVIDVQTGHWVGTTSHICAGVDSYYEYMVKSFLMFGDPDLIKVWDQSIGVINRYMAEMVDGKLYYGRVNMNTGEPVSAVITLYDAFFPATLALAGDMPHATRLMTSWNDLWNQYGIEPMAWDFRSGEIKHPAYDLNPEIMESAYYLWQYTGDSVYFNYNEAYWNSLMKWCRTPLAFTSLANVTTKEQKDYMPTFFFAETLKYLYLTFSTDNSNFRFSDHLFNTEAHPFRRDRIEPAKIAERLGITNNPLDN